MASLATSNPIFLKLRENRGMIFPLAFISLLMVILVPLPPFGMGLAAGPLRRLGVELPPELLSLLKYGRGVDNRRFKRAGFRYQHTTAGTVKAFVEALRLRRTVGDQAPAYHYERDVENFFRHSPAVVRDVEA